MTSSSRDAPSPRLRALAAAYGVATSYRDAAGELHRVEAPGVISALAALGIEAGSARAVDSAFRRREREQAVMTFAPTVVLQPGRSTVIDLRIRTRRAVRARVTTEEGEELACDVWAAADGAPAVGLRYQARMRVPSLRAGWHRLRVEDGDDVHTATVIVSPSRPARPSPGSRTWGWAVQLYAMPGQGSWGMGDYADLAALARWSGGELGAGVLTCNPVHAPSPTFPVIDSPYSPSSRMFHSPLYLRVEATAEYRSAGPALRASVDALRGPGLRPDGFGRVLDRDRVWRAKSAALQLLFDQAGDGAVANRRQRLAEFRRLQGRALEDFATWCALAEHHGSRWQVWPAELRHREAVGVARARAEFADRIEFWAWLQLLCQDQLQEAASAAREAGMSIGIVHDLAVGVDPAGADAWAMQDLLVPGTSIGAPPDAFYPNGQDWGLAGWHPQRLAESGYQAFAQMLRAVLCGAGGVRIDHVVGLFRLWWVPPGGDPARGTYVAYDHEPLLAIVALEAERAGAIVIGEDLGTVDPRVPQQLAGRGVLGSEVLWFARDARDPARPRPPADYRSAAVAAVTTHDLPTAAGYLTTEHVQVRAAAGLLRRGVDEETQQAAWERDALLDLLRAHELLGSDGEIGYAPDELEELIAALHAFLLRTPCQIVLATPGDAIGDRRQPNLPGADRYPNWRLPLAAPSPQGPQPVLLEQFMGSSRVRRLADLLGNDHGPIA